MGFDPICKALNAGYTNSQRLCYEEQAVLTFDGDATGKHIIPISDNANYIRISDAALDLATVVSYELTARDANGTVSSGTFGKDMFTVEETPMGEDMSIVGQILLLQGENEVICSIPDDVDEYMLKGTYVILEHDDTVNADWWISKITTETIHTIDPKYLPSTVTKINLDDYGVDLSSLLLAGGGKQTFDAPGLGEAMGAADEIVFLSETGGYEVKPATILRWENVPFSFGFRFTMYYEAYKAVISADINIASGVMKNTDTGAISYRDEVTAWITNVTQTAFEE